MRRIGFIVPLSIACARTPVRVSPSGPDGFGVADGVQLGWTTKRVLTKQEPTTLIAPDGTICRVTTDRFRNTEIGRDVACNWQLGNPPKQGEPR